MTAAAKPSRPKDPRNLPTTNQYQNNPGQRWYRLVELLASRAALMPPVPITPRREQKLADCCERTRRAALTARKASGVRRIGLPARAVSRWRISAFW